MELNVTDVSTGTGIIEIDLFPLMIQTIIAIAISVGGGTFLGYRLSERSRNKQEMEDIKKVKKLLKDDLERNSKNLVDGILNDLAIIRKIKSKDKTLIARLMKNAVSGSAILIEGHPSLKFSYWNTIVSAGLLIKLDPDEIKKIEEAHDLLVLGVDQIERSFNKFRETLVEIHSSQMDEQSKTQELLNLCEAKLSYRILIRDTVYSDFQDLNISWIDLTKLSDSDAQESTKISLDVGKDLRK